MVTKLDRLARSRRDARDIVEELTAAEVKLNIGGSLPDPNDPIGRLLFNVLAMTAESTVYRAVQRPANPVPTEHGVGPYRLGC